MFFFHLKNVIEYSDSLYLMCNFVPRLHQREGVTPEIIAVSEFLASLLGPDCGGEKELTFLTLRVRNLL